MSRRSPTSRRHRRHRRHSGAVVAAVLAGLLATSLVLTACGSSGGSPGKNGIVVKGSSSSSLSGIRGDQLGKPLVLSPQAQAARFTSSAGGTTTLGTLQQDRLMLVYFGYTHCPDVCPTTMADLGQALRQLPVQVQTHTQVVFVTSDPARDTAAVMKTWLSNFDAGLLLPFVGLTASLKQIDTIATSVGVPLAPPVKQPNGTITVEHGAQIIAFLNGKASVLWLAGTSADNYAHDISQLVAEVEPS